MGLKGARTVKLFWNALTKLLLGLVLVGLFLFLPAGTVEYPNAWIFLGVLFVPVTVMGAVLFWKAPDLLENFIDSND